MRINETFSSHSITISTSQKRFHSRWNRSNQSFPLFLHDTWSNARCLLMDAATINYIHAEVLIFSSFACRRNHLLSYVYFDLSTMRAFREWRLCRYQTTTCTMYTSSALCQTKTRGQWFPKFMINRTIAHLFHTFLSHRQCRYKLFAERHSAATWIEWFFGAYWLARRINI